MSEVGKLKQIIEGLLLAAGRALSLEQIGAVFLEEERPEPADLEAALEGIRADCEGRGFELSKVASGYRLQVRQELAEWVGRLWDERPQRYSRALLETIAIIAYRQPITRGDIEKIRGVAVSTNITRTLLDREWIRVVGHRDVPGRPAMYATTRQFLDYFNLASLEQLPALTEIREIADVNGELKLDDDAPGSRVLDLPDEEAEGSAELVDAELLAEEEAARLATRPLEEILRWGVEDREQDGAERDDEESSVEPGKGAGA